MPRGSSVADCREIGSRYDGQIVVFGETLQKELQKSRVFLVGAGAIGCEMLKNLALMGVGTAGDGAILVADMDRIERSNLSRQFLFRNTDIGESKAGTAVRAIGSMNSAVRCEFFEAKVGPETENLFSDAFFELVTRMMAKDPRDRPSAGEAAELAKQISEKNEHFVVKLKEDEDFGR